MVPERGFEPLSPKAADFESAVYTVPPLWLNDEIIVHTYLKAYNDDMELYLLLTSNKKYK